MPTNTAAVLPPSRRQGQQLVNTLKRTINWDDPDVSLAKFANSLPRGAFITAAFVDVVTAFNGTTPTLAIGTESTAYNNIATTADVDLTATGCTRVERGIGRSIAATAGKAVYGKTTLDAATTGQAVAVITYEGGWES